jgi:CBS domain-containing protein
MPNLKVPIEEVLKAKHSFRWVDPVIDQNATVGQAITTSIDGGLSGMMVVDVCHNREDDDCEKTTDGDVNHSHKRVVGLITSRDLLRVMAKGIKDNLSPDEILNQSRVGDFMTPISQVIYCRPDETVGMCRTIMAKLGIKCIPVLSREGRVEGLITARDMSDFGLEKKELGGKKAYLNDISERVGLSSNTSMAEPPAYLQAHLALEQTPLFANIGVAEMPHPFKTEHGVGMSHRGK